MQEVSQYLDLITNNFIVSFKASAAPVLSGFVYGGHNGSLNSRALMPQTILSFMRPSTL